MNTSSCPPGYGFSSRSASSGSGLVGSTADDGTCALCAQGRYKSVGLTYMVQQGDTLERIATNLSIPGGFSSIYELNKDTMPNANHITVGQVLIMPGAAACTSMTTSTCPENKTFVSASALNQTATTGARANDGLCSSPEQSKSAANAATSVKTCAKCADDLVNLFGGRNGGGCVSFEQCISSDKSCAEVQAYEVQIGCQHRTECREEILKACRAATPYCNCSSFNPDPKRLKDKGDFESVADFCSDADGRCFERDTCNSGEVFCEKPSQSLPVDEKSSTQNAQRLPNCSVTDGNRVPFAAIDHSLFVSACMCGTTYCSAGSTCDKSSNKCTCTPDAGGSCVRRYDANTTECRGDVAMELYHRFGCWQDQDSKEFMKLNCRGTFSTEIVVGYFTDPNCTVANENRSTQLYAMGQCYEDKFSVVNACLEPCPAGQGYAGDADGTMSCKACPVGFYQSTQSSVSDAVCTQMQVSTCTHEGSGFQSASRSPHNTGVPTERAVPIGSTADDGTCGRCAQGRYSQTVIKGRINMCADCEIGKFTDYHGARSCVKCPTGFSTTKAGATTCRYACAAGRFRNVTGTKPDPSLCSDLANDCCAPNGEQMKCSHAATPVRTGKNCSSIVETRHGPVMSTDDDGMFTCYPAGTFDCATCPDGKFSDTNESRACKTCPTGFFYPSITKSEPQEDIGTLLPSKEDGERRRTGNAGSSSLPEQWFESVDESYLGKTSCTQCPSGRTTKTAGTVMRANSQTVPCDICASGYFTAKRCGSSNTSSFLSDSELRELAQCQVSCIKCPEGTFSVDNADVCTNFQSPETVLSKDSAATKAVSVITNASSTDAAAEGAAEAAVQLNSIAVANLTEEGLSQVRALREEILTSLLAVAILEMNATESEQEQQQQRDNATSSVPLTDEEVAKKDAELSVAARNETVAATCIEAVAGLVSQPQQNTQKTAILAADFLAREMRQLAVQSSSTQDNTTNSSSSSSPATPSSRPPLPESTLASAAQATSVLLESVYLGRGRSVNNSQKTNVNSGAGGSEAGNTNDQYVTLSADAAKRIAASLSSGASALSVVQLRGVSIGTKVSRSVGSLAIVSQRHSGNELFSASITTKNVAGNTGAAVVKANLQPKPPQTVVAGNSTDGRSYSFSLPPLPSSALHNDNSGDSKDKGNSSAIVAVDTSLIVWELSPWVFEAGEIDSFCIGLSFTDPNDGNREIDIDLGTDGGEIKIMIPKQGAKQGAENTTHGMSCVFLNDSTVETGGVREWSTGGCRLDVNATAAMGGDYVVCQCTHLTDFGSRLIQAFQSAGRVVGQLSHSENTGSSTSDGQLTIAEKAEANLLTILIMSGMLIMAILLCILGTMNEHRKKRATRRAILVLAIDIYRRNVEKRASSDIYNMGHAPGGKKRRSSKKKNFSAENGTEASLKPSLRVATEEQDNASLKQRLFSAEMVKKQTPTGTTKKVKRLSIHDDIQRHPKIYRHGVRKHVENIYQGEKPAAHISSFDHVVEVLRREFWSDEHLRVLKACHKLGLGLAPDQLHRNNSFHKIKSKMSSGQKLSSGLKPSSGQKLNKGLHRRVSTSRLEAGRIFHKTVDPYVFSMRERSCRYCCCCCCCCPDISARMCARFQTRLKLEHEWIAPFNVTVEDKHFTVSSLFVCLFIEVEPKRLIL